MRIDFSCEVCNRAGSRRYAKGKVPAHFFCFTACQNEWQKSRQDIVEKNRDSAFRKKVSQGLMLRKQMLGDNYHSPQVKEKIGAATLAHWKNYDETTKNRMLQTLRNNAAAKRTYGRYDSRWNALSARIRKDGICHRCGRRDNLAVHHIIPLSQGGSTKIDNLVTLCASCHKIVEDQAKSVCRIIPDWPVVQFLVKERLHRI
ncbi:MAG: HNH endonuclease [Christensenellales bacterium]|jgi:5-methylcytosine-specific restriction endonuclease McrA